MCVRVRCCVCAHIRSGLACADDSTWHLLTGRGFLGDGNVFRHSSHGSLWLWLWSWKKEKQTKPPPTSLRWPVAGSGGYLKRDVAVMRRRGAQSRGEWNTKCFFGGGSLWRSCHTSRTQDWSPWQPSPPGFTQCQLKIASVFSTVFMTSVNLLLGFKWNEIFCLISDKPGTIACISQVICHLNKWWTWLRTVFPHTIAFPTIVYEWNASWWGN